MNFKDVKYISIPEGVVSRITTLDGIVLWIKKGVEPDLPTPNAYELYYTSTDGNIVKLSTLYNGVKPISNTYENGIGRMLFEKKLTEIGQEMFDSCNTLQTIILPNSITTIVRWGFYRCVNLTNITIPDSVTNIDNGAFQICNSLNQITSLNPIAPTLGKDVFFNLPEVGTLYVPQGATGYDVWLENLPEGWSIQYNIPDVPDNPDVPDVPDTPLSNEIWYISTTGIRISEDTLYLPTNNPLVQQKEENGYIVMRFQNEIKHIGRKMFLGCSDLKSVILPNSVTYIYEKAFDSCSALESIVIPNHVTTIEQTAFNCCTSLKSITIPNITTIQDYTFNGCSSLENIVIPNSVTNIGYMAFADCSSLKHITIPDNVTYIDTYAFTNCSKLESICFQGMTEIMYESFSECQLVSSITCKTMTPIDFLSDSFLRVGYKVPTGQPKILYIPDGATGYETMLNQLNNYRGGWTIQYITE